MVDAEREHSKSNYSIQTPNLETSQPIYLNRKYQTADTTNRRILSVRSNK